MTDRSRHPWRAGAALVVGIVLTAVGIGVGVNQLAARLGPVAIVGLLVLGIGLVLVVGGVVGLTRAAPGWWRLLVVLAVVIIALIGVYVVAVSLHAAVPARAAAPSQPPAGLAVEDVLVPTNDGEQLAAWHLPSRTGAAVILVPGAGSSRSGLEEHMRVLASRGFGVLAVDPRGHGASTGRGMDWGWYGETDIPAAVTYLAQRADVDPKRIAALGLSMGGEEAIGAAAVDPRIRAVVAEGATGRCAADLDWLSEVYGWRGTVTEGLEHAKTAIADLLSPASPPLLLREAAAAAAPRSILLVAAGTAPDEQHAAAAIQAAAPGNVDVWVVPGAGHTAGLSTDPAGWADRVLGFLDDATQ